MLVRIGKHVINVDRISHANRCQYTNDEGVYVRLVAVYIGDRELLFYHDDADFLWDVLKAESEYSLNDVEEQNAD